MMLFTGVEDSTKYNTPIYGSVGKYTLSEGVELPYFLSSIPIERVVDELKIAEEYPANLDNTWALTELYQREIDSDRVEADMVKGYLSDPNKLKFFNALTVVLLPKDDEGKILDTFEESTTDDPAIPYAGNDKTDGLWNDSLALKSNFGGVQYVAIGDQARLRWNENNVHAVVVDGQHRLESLRKYRDSQVVFSNSVKATKIPVIFVLISEAAGFKTSTNYKKQSIRSIAREIFTDLNKNAKEVDKARELILDDWSINAKCIRTLLTEEVAKDCSNKLPLTLVRWQDSIIRFDSQYFVNSLVHLDQLLNSILSIRYPNDPLDYNDVSTFVESINNNLGSPSKEGTRKLVNESGVALDEYFETECIDKESKEVLTPLKRLPYSYLEAATAGFEKYHRPYLIKILTEFLPYKNLLDYARGENLIEGTFGKYFAQTKKHQEKLRKKFQSEDENWYKNNIEKHINIMEGFKSEGTMQHWAYKAIFQKAVVELASEIAFVNGDNHLKLKSVDRFIDFLNKLHEKGVLFVEYKGEESFPLWAFIATNPGDGKIRLNKTTIKNIKAVIRMSYYIHIFGDESENSSLSSRILALKTKKASMEWPSSKDAYDALLSCYDKKMFFGNERYDKLDKTARDSEISKYVKDVLSYFLV